MGAKRHAARIICGVILFLALAYYAFLLFGCWTNDEHIQGAAVTGMRVVYNDLCNYRERHGRWPQNLVEAAKEKGAHSGLDGGEVTDLVSRRPFLYYPDAKPGTHAVLFAQPEPHRIGLWPFVMTERLGIRADGRFVDIQDGEREADDSKIRQDCRTGPIKEFGGAPR